MAVVVQSKQGNKKVPPRQQANRECAAIRSANGNQQDAVVRQRRRHIGGPPMTRPAQWDWRPRQNIATGIRGLGGGLRRVRVRRCWTAQVATTFNRRLKRRQTERGPLRTTGRNSPVLAWAGGRTEARRLRSSSVGFAVPRWLAMCQQAASK